MAGANTLQGRKKISEEQNVAIRVAEQVVPCDSLSPRKHGAEELGAELVAFDVRLVAEAEFAADFSGTRIVTEENDFSIGMELFPAGQGIALNDATVTGEGFAGGEESEHRGRSLRIVARAARKLRVRTALNDTPRYAAVF